VGPRCENSNCRGRLVASFYQELRQAWVDTGGVLILRDQGITPELNITFSRYFGDLAVGQTGHDVVQVLNTMFADM
jgi:alpha-ketoglutarate-dependent taurine dioxygenase